MKRFLLAAWEILEIVAIAAATVFIIRTFLLQPFLVSGASMEPTYSNGNYLIVDELTYRLREPQRGEVSVFEYSVDPKRYFIKRIIGVPGERIVSRSGVLKVYRGTEVIPLDETYLSPALRSSDTFDVTLGEHQYFMLGDNRAHSFDSRDWGAVNRDHIVGVVRLRIFPFDEISIFNPPAYPVPAQ